MPENRRYSRQILLPQVGDEGQNRLARSRAVVVGCGALGTVQASLLVRAGLGETVLIDRDYVEKSNLQRQWLFEECDAEQGTPKAVAAEQQLKRVNSEVKVLSIVRDLNASNAESLLAQADVILDGTDNYATRYLINDVAIKLSIPWVYGAAVGMHGSVMPILPGTTACLTCLFPTAPVSQQQTCDTAGVLNTVPALIASLQVTEAFKILLDREEDLQKRLVSSDLWSGERSAVRTDLPTPECITCGQNKFVHLEDLAAGAVQLCGRDAVHVRGPERTVDLELLASRLAALGSVQSNEHVLRFCCPPHVMTVFRDGRAIIKGTKELAIAHSLYARYVGE